MTHGFCGFLLGGWGDGDAGWVGAAGVPEKPFEKVLAFFLLKKLFFLFFQEKPFFKLKNAMKAFFNLFLKAKTFFFPAVKFVDENKFYCAYI